jgi:hypothetical protein
MCTTKSYLPFQWLYPGAYQPLQPVAVLLIDLLNNPQSSEASKSRALLEKTFSLLGPKGRITNGTLNVTSWSDQGHASAGAKQAWMRLEKLRSKVWQKLGLDHGVLWMRTIRKTVQHSESAGYAKRWTPNRQIIAQQSPPSERDKGLDANLPFGTEPQKLVSRRLAGLC